MLPESENIMGEIIVRKMRVPEGVIAKKGLVRWLALSLGLINEKETRTMVLPILEAIIHLDLSQKSFTSNEIILWVKKIEPKAQEKALRYHISQLKKKGILFEKDRQYYLGDPMKGSTAEERLQNSYRKEFDESFSSISRIIAKLRITEEGVARK